MNWFSCEMIQKDVQRSSLTRSLKEMRACVSTVGSGAGRLKEAQGAFGQADHWTGRKSYRNAGHGLSTSGPAGRVQLGR